LIENVLPRFDKCAIVVDGALPSGLAMNAAAVLAFSLGHVYGQPVLGPDVKDRDGQVHRAITAAPIPILTADAEGLRVIVAKASADPELFLVDFTEAAQAARDYDDYTASMVAAGSDEHVYVGLALAGPKKSVNRLTGSMALYR
jgi:hypothetical protein